jgi:hypothetical protein
MQEEKPNKSIRERKGNKIFFISISNELWKSLWQEVFISYRIPTYVKVIIPHFLVYTKFYKLSIRKALRKKSLPVLGVAFSMVSPWQEI